MNNGWEKHDIPDRQRIFRLLIADIYQPIVTFYKIFEGRFDILVVPHRKYGFSIKLALYLQASLLHTQCYPEWPHWLCLYRLADISVFFFVFFSKMSRWLQHDVCWNTTRCFSLTPEICALLVNNTCTDWSQMITMFKCQQQQIN